MPDPENKTISATESPALFDASPYVTRWMLYHKFANGKELDRPVNNRMDWGLKMQPLVLQQAAEDMKLEVRPNDTANYSRRGLLGYTSDGVINCPGRGPGALEVKCVFDFDTWGRNWNNGQSVPRHYEIQLQHQMLVGDGEGPFEWGLIAVWCCAEMHYFERKPIADFWRELRERAEDFFEDVDCLHEPDPFGLPQELSLLREVFPLLAASVLDLSNDPEHVKSSEMVSMYKHHKELATANAASAEELRGRLLALAKGNGQVLLPCGVNYRVKKSGRGLTIDPYVPDVPLPPPQQEGSVLNAG